ncbi:MAG: ParB N-terminal domain-containing protein [Oscillospiraceae bacterium]
MAKKPFSVSDYIKPEDVSKLDTEATAITFIPRERLLQNEKNFYDTSSIDELADSIALNGLIEPIIVRPVRDGSGDYRIISGHRRFLAISELAKDEPERWARVPAIIREPASDVLEELLLIEANRATGYVISGHDAPGGALQRAACRAETSGRGDPR